MENIQLPESPDVNKDGLVDQKDIKLLENTLAQMDFDTKVSFVHDIKNKFNRSENSNLLIQLRDVLDKEIGIDNKDNELYLLYQSLFLEGDIIDNKLYNKLNYESFSSEEQKVLNDSGIDKKTYNSIMNSIGLDNLNFIFNYSESPLRFLVNYKNFGNKLDLEVIYNFGNIDINDVKEFGIDINDKNTIDNIKLFYKYGEGLDIKQLKVLLNGEQNKFLKFGNIDNASYLGLKDMGEDINSIEVLMKNNKDIFNILRNKGIKLDLIVNLIKNEFPVEKYKEYLTKDNIYTITILYNRMKFGLNNIKDIETIIKISNNITEDEYKKEFGGNYIEKYGEDISNISNDFVLSMRKAIPSINIDNILDIYYYIDYSKSDLTKNSKINSYKELNKDFYNELYTLFVNLQKANNDLSINELIDILLNNKNINEYIKAKESISNNKDESLNNELNDLFLKTEINIDLFNKVIGKTLGGVSLEKTKGSGIEINGDIDQEYIIDILKIDGLKDFLVYLDNNNVNINILGENINIKENIQFIKDILEYKNINNSLKNENDFGKIIELYSNDLNEFLEIPNKKDTVFVSFQGNYLLGGDDVGAFLGEKGFLRDIFKNSEHIDISITSKEKTQTPDEIISNLELIIKNKGNNDIIFYIGVHGGRDGTAGYAGGKLGKDFFQKLNNLANKYSNFKVKIDSCYSGTKLKDENIKGNIFMTSENETATSAITGILKGNKDNLDYNKDGKISLKEIAFTEMLNYKGSLLGFNNFHSFIKNKNGNIMNIPHGDKYILSTKKS